MQTVMATKEEVGGPTYIHGCHVQVPYFHSELSPLDFPLYMYSSNDKITA